MKSNVKGRVGITINAPSEKVWKGLTDPKLIKQYFFGTDAKSDWKKGSPITFSGEWEGRKYQDKGTVLDVTPERLLKYNYWSSMSGIEDKPENYVVITYEVFPGGNTTDLVITQENIPNEEMKKHSEDNWRKVLEGLKKVVEEG